MKNLWKILGLCEAAAFLLIVSGLADANMAYISLFVLLLGVWKLSVLEALQLYIVSIPVFVAMPSSALSEAMSIWRVALLMLTLRVVVEKFQLLAIVRDKTLDLGGKGRALVRTGKDFLRETRRSNYFPLLRPAVLFGGVGLGTLFFAVSIGAGIKKLIFLYGIFLLFGIVSFAVRSREDWRRLIRTVYGAALFILFVGYGQLLATFLMTLSDFWGLWDNYVISALYGEKTMVLLSYSNTWFSYYGSDEIPATLRMFSVMPDSHSFAMLMILFSPLALFFARTAPTRKRRFAHTAVLLLMLLAIFFSGTRGAWVGWLGALVSSVWLYKAGKLPFVKRQSGADPAGRKKTYKAVLASVLALIALFPVSNVVLTTNQDVQLIREGKLAGQERLAMFKRTWSISDLEETSNKGRMEIWRDSVASFVRHPLTGIGIGNFPLALSEKLATAKMGASAHNLYLDILVEMGLLGLLSFLWLLGVVARKLCALSGGLRQGGLRLLAGAMLVYFVWIGVYGLFDVVLFNDKVLMFAVIILALLYKTETLESQEPAG